ncbi:MAG: hypothetical protein IPH95_15420 [Candidatus Promineofilum sp.]|nr:hypothetical protein [Promineifilum sp.]
MNLGPVEYAVIAFPGNRFNGDVVPALSELVDSGTVHIIDLVFVHKDADGILTIGELEQLDAELGAVFAELEGDIDGLLSEEDLSDISALLSDNSSAAVIVWENLWAERFANAVRASGGQLVDSGRIPHEVALAAMEYSGIED